MNKNLILIITIFSFWLFTYLSDVKKEKTKKDANGVPLDMFESDDIKYTNNQVTFSDGVTQGPVIPNAEKPGYNKNGVKMYDSPIGPSMTKNSGGQYIMNPVTAKGE